MLRRAALLALAFAAAIILCGGCGRMGDPIPPGQALLAPVAKPEFRGRDGALLISWTAPSKTVGGGLAEPVRGYLVERLEYEPGVNSCETCPASPSKIERADTTSYSDSSVRPGYTYRYRILAVDYRDRVGQPSPWADIEWVAPPAMPQISLTGIHLGVEVAIGPVPESKLLPVGLAIYKKGGGLIQRIPAGVRESSLTGFPNDKPVRLVLRWETQTPGGWVAESLASEREVVPRDTSPPEAPHGVAAFPEAEGVSIHWIAPVGEQATVFIIERATGDGAWVELARVTGASLSYADLTAKAGESYRYRVTPVDGAGNVGKPSVEGRAKAGRPR